MKRALINSKIYVERDVFAQALLIEDGIISAVGDSDTILSIVNNADTDADIEITDCGGKTVIPGLNDSHMHMMKFGENLAQAEIFGSQSIDDLISRVKSFIKKHPERCTHGVHAVGWNQDLFTSGEKRMPTRHDLDMISCDIPVVLERVCGHIASANTKAIQLLGLDVGSEQYAGGTFELEPDGYPNGIFTENAIGYLLSSIPDFTDDEIESLFIEAMSYAVSRGLTSVQSNDAGTGNEKLYSIIRKIFTDGKAKLRYHFQNLYEDTDSFSAFISGEHANGDYSHPWLSLGPLKMLRDGSLGGRTATMRHEYLDDPDNYGVEALSDEKMNALCAMADAAGIQVIIHAIGDKAISDVLDCYEPFIKDGNPLRHGIVHCQITDRELLERIVRDDVGVMYQPIFLDYDMHAVISRCGRELSSSSYAFGSMSKLCAKVSYGTDCPVEDCNPFPCIYSAVTRRDKNGYPDGGFFPDECVDVYTAVDAYTYGSAYNQFEEDVKGRLKPGFYADMVILDRDIFSCDTNDIKDILPVMTIVDGKTVFSRSI